MEVWSRGISVGHINEVTLLRARLVLGWVIVPEFISQSWKIYFGLPSHPGQLSLAIPQWVGGMSTGDGLLTSTREEMASSV